MLCFECDLLCMSRSKTLLFESLAVCDKSDDVGVSKFAPNLVVD